MHERTKVDFTVIHISTGLFTALPIERFCPVDMWITVIISDLNVDTGQQNR